jgi:hypothetical protein
MKGAAELAELRPKGKQTRDDCISETGRAKALSFRKRGAGRGPEDRTEKFNVFAALGSSRRRDRVLAFAMGGGMKNEMISREFDIQPRRYVWIPRCGKGGTGKNSKRWCQ